MKRSPYLLSAAAMLVLAVTTGKAQAEDCKLAVDRERVNLNVPVAVQLPLTTGSAASGTVLYRKEAPLALLSGLHKNIDMQCLNALRKRLTGRIPGAQSGKHIYATTIDGLGVRITAIYDKPGVGHKEWPLPFSAEVAELKNSVVSTDDIALRLEVIKTGTVNPTRNMDFRIPSLLTLADNALVVSLTMKLMAAKAHCAIQVENPQVTLPPIDARELMKGDNTAAYPVNVSLNCLNTQRAAITIEGVTDPTRASVFKNVAEKEASQGVGIQMLYSGSVMVPDQALSIALPAQQNTFPLPLAVRYARTQKNITGGNVKSQITMRINYL